MASTWRRPNPYACVTVGVALSVLIAPWFCYEFDVFACWVPWMNATGGTRPWAVYAGTTRYPCNYPPALPYLWTATAAARRLLPVLRHRGLTLELLKLPNVFAWAAGVPLCDRGLRRSWGNGRARAAAVAYALSVPLLLDAAVWGQYDAVLSLATVAVVVALIDGQPVWAGAAAGLAVGIKAQAVVSVPVAVVYAVRRFGVARSLLATAAAGAVLGTVSLPMVIAGRGRPMAAAYTGAVDFYPVLTANAGNVWQPVRLWIRYAHHQPTPAAESDAVSWGHGVTPKRVGLTAFAAYAALICAGLWRRPDGPTLARAAALTAFGFFMLPTQMHERYLVPAAALLAVPAGWGRGDRRLYGWVAASAAVHLIVQQFHESVPAELRQGRLHRLAYDGPLLVVTAADLVLLVAATAGYVRSVGAAVGPDLSPDGSRA